MTRREELADGMSPTWLCRKRGPAQQRRRNRAPSGERVLRQAQDAQPPQGGMVALLGAPFPSHVVGGRREDDGEPAPPRIRAAQRWLYELFEKLVGERRTLQNTGLSSPPTGPRERRTGRATLALRLNPWRARRSCRRWSSPPRGCRRRCGSAPWCARRSTGSPA
jgi:hypothetical protein